MVVIPLFPSSLSEISISLQVTRSFVIQTVDNMCWLPGRAIGVGALGNFDLRDEAEGLDAGTAMREYADQLHINGKVGVGERFVLFPPRLIG